MHRETVAVLGGPPQPVDVGDVELGVDAVGEQVHRQRDDVDVAGALAVAEEGSLDTICSRHDSELGRSHRTTTIVVGVEAQHDGLAATDGAVEPLDHVAIDVGGVALDRRRQVQDDGIVRGWIHLLDDRFTYLEGEVRLGQGEALGGVLVPDRGVAHRLLQLATELRRVDRDVLDPLFVHVEHDVALERVGRVVEVDDRPGCPGDGVVGPLDELIPALGEHLDGHVLGDQVVLDQLAHEVEVGLAGRREADLDLLEAHGHELLEHAQLARRIHRVDERLVAVPEIDRAPAGCLVDDDIRPGAVLEHQRHKRLVFVEWHLLESGFGGRHGSPCVGRGSVARPGKEKAPGRGRANTDMCASALHEEEESARVDVRHGGHCTR